MEDSQSNKLQNKNIVRLIIITLLILSLPLCAMLFNWQVIDPGDPVPERVNWDYFDFLVMGTLIFGIGLAYEFLTLKATRRAHRIIIAVGLLLLFCLIWAELAVGIFGTPFAGS